MLLILAIVFGALAFATGLIGFVGVFFAVGVFAVVSRFMRLAFLGLAAVFVVLLLLLVF